MAEIVVETTLDELIEQVGRRRDTEPDFMARLTPAVEIIAASASNVEQANYAAALAGLALHIDDIAHGRWQV